MRISDDATIKREVGCLFIGSIKTQEIKTKDKRKLGYSGNKGN